MAGRKQELIEPFRQTITIEKAQRDWLIETYGTYGVSRVVRQLIDEHRHKLGEVEPQDTVDTVEFGSMVQL
jgi:hypothetical protein